VKRLFDRLHVWLAANAPDVLERFAPGASEAEIRGAEQQMGVALPDDVRAAYRIHDGCDSSFLYGDEWCSLAAMVSNWRMLKGLLDDGSFTPNRSRPVGPIRAVWYHPAWIPITDDHTGYYHCLDLAPKAKGHVGQVIHWFHDNDRRLVDAKSFRGWLSRFTWQLEEGTWRFDPQFYRWTDGG
jgi:cell wall assembly regulator SMI1